jgi:CHAD domain-containing protein
MKILAMPKLDILQPVRFWGVEDRHQLRVFLRRLRIQVKLLKKSKCIRGKKNKFFRKLRLSELEIESKDLLEDCGRIRDIDVLLKTISYSSIKNEILKENLRKQRVANIANLNQKWTLSKRRKLVRNSKHLLTFLEKKRPIKKKTVSKKGKQIISKLVNKDPVSKFEWHDFRRKLRRANYLLDLSGERNKNLEGFQKFLGMVHDLENLQKVMNKSKTYSPQLKIPNQL